MRIRNSRPPFPPSLSDPTSRSMHLPSQNGLYFDDRFLVQETNRQIGWSCYPLKSPAYPCGELRKLITMEIRPISHVDEKKGESYYMQDKSIQAQGGQHEAQANEADEGNEPCVFTKERGNTIQEEKTNVPAGDRDGKRQKGRCEPENKMEPGNISDQNIEDKNSCKRTRTLCCPINCKYFIPPENKGFEVHGMPEGMGLDYTVAEKENPRRGRKMKEGDQSGDANWSIETFMGSQTSKEGRLSKTGRNTANGNDRSGERQKPRRGRPRKIISRSAFTL